MAENATAAALVHYDRRRLTPEQSHAETVDEDRTLVSAARDDTEAAGRLYDRHYGAIRNYIFRCTLDRTATDDLTSNTFLAAFRHLRRFQWRQIPFRAWLYRIATNEVRMYYRRQKRATTVSLQAADNAGQERLSRLEPTEPSASDRLAATEEYRLLHEALLQLKLKYRTVIILRYFEDKAIAEIAEITRRRQGTVKSQLHRGLARLQDILIHRGILTP
jgi:RNA polymerase sigma-70 factor (ECF subfamily)